MRQGNSQAQIRQTNKWKSQRLLDQNLSQENKPYRHEQILHMEQIKLCFSKSPHLIQIKFDFIDLHVLI